MSIRLRRERLLWVWLLWLVGFYAVWLWLVFGFARWDEVRAHWPIALAMAFGSYLAGSTPIGGGSVGFATLVLLFGLPASLGRDFSFAVQSIGMTSASLFMLARRQPIAWPMLKGAMLGASIGTPLGILFVAPRVPELAVKLAFAIAWASFGLLHLRRISEITALGGAATLDARSDLRVGCALGLLASASVVAVTGVGIEMTLYAALVLLCRADLKVAIPTAVMIMAYTSVIGIAVQRISTGIQPGVFENWLAASPVVVLGAPLGAFVVARIGRRPILIVVALLCVAQFAWTCASEWAALGAGGLTLALLAIALLLLGFERLRVRGMRRAAAASARAARGALGCALLCSLALAGRARAHESDYSYLRLDVAAQRVHGELEIHARDALFLLGADPALAEADAWRALKSLEPQLRDRLARGVEIRSASQPCPLSIAPGMRADPGGRDYASFRLDAECAAAIETLEIRYPLLFALDVRHRGFFAIRDARQTHVGVFTANEPSLRVAIAQSERWQQFADYAREGVAHIAAGFDHLLFLITLLLPVVLTRTNGSWQPRASPGAVLRQAVAIATAFTLAHSITLALAVFELVRLPARLVESSIAFSVLVAAWNNLRPFLRGHGWWLAFGFGLVHGLGFAGALAQLGLPAQAKGLALLAFNLGVEAGQLAIVAALVPLLYLLRTRAWYERAVLGVGSWLVAWIAAIWLLERALALELVSWL